MAVDGMPDVMISKLRILSFIIAKYTHAMSISHVLSVNRDSVLPPENSPSGEYLPLLDMKVLRDDDENGYVI